MPVVPTHNIDPSTKVAATVVLPPQTVKPDTIAITLTQAPPPTAPLWENVSFIVGVFTLAGIVLSLWFAHIRMKNELNAANQRADLDRTQTAREAVLDREHDAKLAHQERVTVARRAVYLEVCEEVIKTQEFIGQISVMNPNKFKPGEGTAGLIRAMSKMSILGEMETVLLGKALLNKLMVVLFENLPKAFLIQDRVDAIEQNQRKIDAAQIELKRILMGMKNIVENTPEEQTNFQKLQQEFDEQLKISRQGNEQVKQLQQEVNLMRRKLNEETLDQLISISAHVDELVHSVRAELGLFTSLEQLRDASKSAHDLAQEVVAKLHALMEGPPAA